MKKIALLVLIAALAAGFFYFDLNQLLTLDGLKSGLTQFDASHDESPFFIGVPVFVVIRHRYRFVFAQCIDYDLGSGPLFHLLWGTVIVSFASSIAATLHSSYYVIYFKT